MRLDDVDLTDLDRFAHGFPHDVFTLLRREAPVWFHPPTGHTPGGEGFWVVTKHADCLAAGSDAATFSSHTGPGRDGAGGTIIEDLPGGFAAGVLLNMMDDPRHQRIRNLLTPAMSPRALAALEENLRERTAHLVDAVAGRGECDLVLDVAAELPLQAIAHLLGVPQDDRHLLFGWANATLDYDDRDLGQRSERTQAASAAMFEYGTRLIDERRGGVGGDMLSTVVASRDPELTDVELQMFFNLLIAAGSETTRNSITLGLLALAARPDHWRLLDADRSLLPKAVEEVLRWASTRPTTVAPPRSTRPCGTSRSGLATRSRCGGRRRTMTRTSSSTPTRSRSTSPAGPTPTSRSVTAPTTASAPTWPAPRSDSCSRRSSIASTA